MVMDSGLDYLNIVPKHIIEDNVIKSIKTHTDNKTEKDIFIDWKTNSHLKNPIFMEFISIDPSDDEQIIRFCNTYGLLGISETYAISSVLEHKMLHFLPEEIDNENLNDFKNEIQKMKDVLELVDFITTINLDSFAENSSREMLYDRIVSLVNNLMKYLSKRDTVNEKIEKNTWVPEIEKSFFYLKEYASEAVLMQINRCVRNIFPQLNSDGHRNRTNFISTWKAPTLLAAMYHELYLKISQNKKIRKCRNSTCSRYFEIIGNDLRKIYCDSDCAKLEAKRKERARKKNAK